MSEALIFVSINPQYENILSMELPWKLQAQNMGRTCSAHVLIMFCACSFHGNSMDNMFSYCGLIDAKIRASYKDLPVLLYGWKNDKQVHTNLNYKFFLKTSRNSRFGGCL